MEQPDLSFKEFDHHRLVSYIHDPHTGLEGFIVIHRGTLQNPAFGATRIVSYGSKAEALTDALRLSRAMSYKSAMAGLPYGGAKGVIISPPLPPQAKKELLRSYAEKINYLNGHFITGADVGVDLRDVRTMAADSPFLVGLNSDPVKFTTLGMVNALSVCLDHIFGTDKLSGRTFAIQGVGKIGGSFLKLIYKQAGKIYVSDVDHERLAAIKRLFPKVEVVTPEAIYRQKVDVFSPCALGHVLTTRSIAKIKAKIIMGGANDQLQDSAVGILLYKLGVLYAPDYVVNAGGLIAVVDEYEHKHVDSKRIIRRLNNIKVMMHSIIQQSSLTNRATNLVVDEMAEKIFNHR